MGSKRKGGNTWKKKCKNNLKNTALYFKLKFSIIIHLAEKNPNIHRTVLHTLAPYKGCCTIFPTVDWSRTTR